MSLLITNGRVITASDDYVEFLTLPAYQAIA